MKSRRPMYDHALAHKHICNAIEQSFQAERYSDTAFSLVTLVCGIFFFFFVWVPRKIMLSGAFGENVAPLRETIGDYQEPEGDHRVTPPPPCRRRQSEEAELPWPRSARGPKESRLKTSVVPFCKYRACQRNCSWCLRWFRRRRPLFPRRACGE